MQNLKISPKEAQQELARRELARRYFKYFAPYIYDGYTGGWHTRLICEALDYLHKGDIRFLLIEAPPRHSKSLHVSQLFPAYVVGKDKNASVIVASYSGDLATDHGRETRNLIETPAYRNVFDTKLAQDSTAKGKWNTDGRGAYNAAGVGGSLTGKGADFFIIDDPLKDRKEADSALIREERWKWFTSVARTRLTPNGRMAIMHCMVGDTRVLMADGTEKFLRDIKPGDKIATYDDGRLTTSVVKNWANQGVDCVFTIKMKSGRIVRANERHPFLVVNKNKTQWTKVKDLRVGNHILGVHGQMSHANTLNANCLLGQKDSVLPITAKQGGQSVIDHHPQIPYRTEMRTLNTGTEFHWRNIIQYLKNRAVSVRCVGVLQFLVKMFLRTGKENSAWTTATTQIESGGYCAITATSLSEAKQHQNCLKKQLNTLKIEPDEIESIFQSGYEDVFDIEVERTENFIANGLVSHNTRWHQDDIIGRLTEGDKKEKWITYEEFLKNGLGDAKWVRLTLKAVAEEDETYRKLGEPLWPERYPLAELEDIRSSLGPYEFSALYQQNPVDDQSREFKTKWINTRTYADLEKIITRKFATIDTALKKTEGSDYTGVTRNYVNEANEWHFRAERYRLDARGIIDLIFTLHEEGFEKIGIEEGAFTYVVEPFLREEMKIRNTFPNIVPLKHNGTMKETRIRGLIPRYSFGKVFHLEGQCTDLENEMLVFPKGANDDVIDSAAYQLQIAEPPGGKRVPQFIRKIETRGV